MRAKIAYTRKHIVIPSTTPRMSEPVQASDEASISVCGNMVLDSRLTEKVEMDHDENITAHDVGISAADSSLLLDMKRFSQQSQL